MSSLKCRCGSDDKIRVENGMMLRIADNKPHVCLGAETAQSAASEQTTISEKQKAEQTQKPQEDLTGLVLFTKKQYEEIRIIEDTLRDLNEDFTNNGARLGLYINNIRQAWQQKKIAEGNL